VYGKGAEKYAPNNWEKGYAWGLSVAALERHVSQFKQGVNIDPETGCQHLAHAVFHCLTLISYAMCGLGTDDRSKLRKEPSVREMLEPL
jgi:hypothetical protein